MFSSTEITDFPKLRSSTCAVNQTGLKLAIQDRLTLNKWDFNSRVSLAFCGHYLRTLVVAVGSFIFWVKNAKLTFFCKYYIEKKLFLYQFLIAFGLWGKAQKLAKNSEVINSNRFLGMSVSG